MKSSRLRFERCVATLIGMLIAISALQAASTITIPKAWQRMSSERLNDIGISYVEQAKTDSALLCFSIVANRYVPGMKGKEALQCAYAYNNCGSLYSFDYYDYQKSLENLLMAEKVYNASGSDDSLVMVLVNLNMGNLYLMFDDVTDQNSFFSQKATELYSRAFRSGGNRITEHHMKAFINMASDYPTKEYYSLIQEDVERMDSMKPQTVPLFRYAQAQAKALKCIVNGDIENAAKWYLKQLHLIDAPYDSMRYVINSYESLSDLYRENGEKQKAISYALRVDSIATADEESDVIVRISRKLYKLYAEVGDSTAYHHYHSRYLEYRDNLATSSHVGKVSDIYFLAEVDNMKNEIVYSESRSRQKTLIIVGIAVLLFLTGCFAMIVFRKNRELRQRNQMLYLKNKEVLSQLEASQKTIVTTAVEKYSTVSIKDEEKQRLMKAIGEILCSSKEIYQPTFSLSQLAELVGSNQRYVSQVVNEMFGKNFNALLNEYRIAEACRRLDDLKNNRNVTIESIANSVGFKSRNAFGVAFKKETGLTPSEWIRSAKMPSIEI